MESKLSHFDGHAYLNLESVRRNGTEVRTPVWFTRANGHLYVRTLAGSGKVKRIHNNRRVRIVPCEVNGKPIGQWLEAQAEEVNDPATAAEVTKLLEEKYGKTQVRVFTAAAALRGQPYTVLKIQP